MKRILGVGLGVVAGYLMTLGVVQVAAAWGLRADRATERGSDRVAQVMRLINRHYVDPTAVGGEELSRRAIEGLVGGLDRYSEYLTPEARHQLEEEVGGAFGGVGLQVEEVDGRIHVVAPIAGTPGDRAGILRGDILVRAGETDLRGLKLADAIRRLRGDPGTEISLVVERGSPPREQVFNLRREIIRVESVRDAALVEDGIGYVRVTLFGDKTAREFKDAVRQLRDRGARALVLDLRSNPGGLVTAAVGVAEAFFPRGELVVYLQGRDPGDRENLLADDPAPPWSGPLAVLVNGGSASASEIVAGALRDTGRAVLVGEKTFGKGSVQTILPLDGKAGLRLTTARYYTPSGAVIHERGIEPDLVEKLSPEQEKAVFLARLRPDLAADPKTFEARFGVAPVEDVQLAAALRELRAELAGAAPSRRAPQPAVSQPAP